MAYQLPPPPPVEDTVTRDWFYEVYKRNQDVLDTSGTITLTGDVTAPATAAANGSYSVPTAIALPNVSAIDGGDATETFPDTETGPYGATAGSDLVVQDTTATLTTTCTLLNFEGFTVTEPVANQITISVGTAPVSDLLAPGYNYTTVSDTTFTCDLVDTTIQFTAGRRIKFSSGNTDSYGVISINSDYDSTAADDTFVTVVMEDGGIIPATIENLWFTASDTAWVAIADDPMGGEQINGIATGSLNGTQWWVIVGNGGKLYTSTNKGNTWQQRTSGTTGDILSVLYCPAVNGNTATFYVGGKDSSGDFYMRKSTDGSTWTTYTPVLSFALGTGDYLFDMCWGTRDNMLGLIVRDASASRFTVNISDDFFVLNEANDAFPSSAETYIIASPESDSVIDDWFTHAGALSEVYTGGYPDDTGSTFVNPTPPITGMKGFYSPGIAVASMYTWIGCSNGDIIINDYISSTSKSTDTGTFSYSINDFADGRAVGRVVCVGNNGQIGYLPYALYATAGDNWIPVANGFSPTTDVTGVAFNESDQMFVAVASNGQICRSSTGIA